MRADRVTGIVTVAAGALIAFASAGIETIQGGGTLSARFFPYLLSAVLVLAGVALAVFPGTTSLGEVVRRLLSRSAVLFGVAFLVYALAFPYIDYRLGTWLFMFAAMWLLGSRRVVELLVVPTVVSLLTFYLFRYGFTVLLPTWT